jgi:hypothetical protein
VDTNYFDVVVYGSELTGLIAASLLGRRGLRVLLCGHDGVPATFQAGPYTLAREPGTLPPPDSEPVARVLRELGHSQIVRRRAPQAQPSLQFVFPNHRVEFTSSVEAVLAELVREFPEDHGTIEPILARLRATSAILDPLLGSDMTLPPQGFWERRDVSRVQPSCRPRKPTCWRRLGRTISCAPASPRWAPWPAGSPRPISAAWCRRAPTMSRGGVSTGWPARPICAPCSWTSWHLLGRDSRARGSHRAGMAARKSERAAGAAAQRNHRLRPPDLGRFGVVAGCLAGSEAPRRLREIASAIRPACFRYTLCMLVRPEALPEGMGARVIAVKDPAKPNLEENAFSITVGLPPPRQPNQIPIWLECLVSASASESLGYLSVVRARLREELLRIMPFHDQHLIVVASPHDGCRPSLGPRRGVEPGERGRLPGVPPTPMTPALSCDLQRVLGLGGASHTTGLKNVYLASNENLPGLGREGQFVSAWGVARLIAEPAQHKARAASARF